jgi:Putative Ig domain
MQQRNISRRRAQLRIATLFSSLVLIAPAVVQGQTVSTWWDPNSADEQVTGYDVCVGTSSGSCNVRVASVAAPSTSYTLSPTGGTLYYVAVRAKNAFGVSAYSPEVAFSIPSLGQPSNQTSVAGVAITPVNLSVVDPDGGSVTLTHTGLPVGLSLNSSTRRITGTPAAVGTYNVTVLANDGIVTVSRSFTWTVTSSGSGGGAPPANPTPPSGGTQINVSPGTVSRGAWITTSWSGIAVPSATDWIALYVPGTPNTAHIEWVFTSCSQTPAQARSSGSCPFVVPSNLPPGTYEVRLLANNGYTALATSASFTVTATSGGVPPASLPPASLPPSSGGTQINASPGTVSRGTPITASWSGVAVPSATDWIGLYVPGTPNTSHIDFVFTSCSQAPGQAVSSGSCPFVVPSNVAPGTYEVRLLANNGYTALATSASFTVR